MPCAKKFSSNRGHNSQFFTEFADQGFLRRLAGLDFSAREFPLQGARIIAMALADQNLGVTEDQRRNDRKFGLP